MAAFVLVLPGVAQAASGYTSPFSTPDYYVGRTDMGVDVCLTAGDPIRAVGNGVVIGIQKNWYAKQPYIWYELTSGPDAGSYVYVAEQITHLAALGQTLSGGQTIATYASKGSCIETGWATADGTTMATATTGYTEGQVTASGISFAKFLIGLGVQGTFELTAPEAPKAPKAQAAAKKKSWPAKKVLAAFEPTKSAKKPMPAAKPKIAAAPSPSGGSSSVAPPATGGAIASGGAGATGAGGGAPSGGGAL